MEAAIAGRETAKSCPCTTGGWSGSRDPASQGRRPRPAPTTSTGTRSPGWSGVTAPRGWPCVSPADDRYTIRTAASSRRACVPDARRRPGPPLPGVAGQRRLSPAEAGPAPSGPAPASSPQARPSSAGTRSSASTAIGCRRHRRLITAPPALSARGHGRTPPARSGRTEPSPHAGAFPPTMPAMYHMRPWRPTTTRR